MEFIAVDNENVAMLKSFIDNIGEAGKSFRYFNTRDITVIDKHLVTLLLVDGIHPLAYGHLENEGNETWLGICVTPGHNGKGLGRLMMTELINKARELSVHTISLTVDKVNDSAINLYTKFGFEKIKTTENYYMYQLALTK